jgi:hypothetical protein
MPKDGGQDSHRVTGIHGGGRAGQGQGQGLASRHDRNTAQPTSQAGPHTHPTITNASDPADGTPQHKEENHTQASEADQNATRSQRPPNHHRKGLMSGEHR